VHPLSKLLLALALLLAGVGVVLAVVRPGDLDGATEAAGPGATEPDDRTTTTVDGSTTTTTADDGGTTTTTGDGGTTTTTTTTTVGDGTTPTTSGGVATTTTTTTVAGGAGGGSGLAGGGSAGPSDLEDGLADTGGESLLAASVVLALVALALPRRA